MIYEKPEPIADYEDTREVPGRMAADGTVVRELDAAAARAAVAELRDRGVEALTVSLMNSFASPDHEREVAQIAREEAPGLSVSISSDVMPEFREYERTVTTVVNAYVSPVLDRYLSSLSRGLDAVKAGADLQVVRSDGGLMSVDSARLIPVHTVLSGPAGGVKGAAFVASGAGFDRILTFDMGGTSTDVATCAGGQPIITRETTVGEFPVRAPSVEVESIGAGGGSIAYIADVTGALRVGPQSAGADPGPACYGRGGTEATVTDANVVLGHLPPRLLGGEMELDVDAAHAAVGALASQLGLDVHAAAAGIVDIVNESMLGALRVVTVQKGLPPTEFALVSFGGAGGLHANALAALLGCFPVLVPPESGVLSALGFVAAEIKNEFSQTYIRDAEAIDGDELRARLAALAEQADQWLEGERVEATERSVDYVVDMRYQRQGFEIPIDIVGRRARRADDPGADRALRRRAPPSLRLRPGRRSRAGQPARGRARRQPLAPDPESRSRPGRPLVRAGRARTPSGPAEPPRRCPPTPAPSCAPACGSRATRSSSSTTPPRSCCRATPPPSTTTSTC